MLKNISAGSPNPEYRMNAIQERNKKIRERCFCYRPGGITNSGYLIIVGDTKEIAEKAGNWLNEKVCDSRDIDYSVHQRVVCENKFAVQVWEAYDFDINFVLEDVIPNKLRSILLNKKIETSRLSKMTGISESIITEYKFCRRSISLLHALKISKSLNISPFDLIDLE